MCCLHHLPPYSKQIVPVEPLWVDWIRAPMGVPSDDVVLIQMPKRSGDPTLVTVNCPDKHGLGCDLCTILLEFGLHINRAGIIINFSLLPFSQFVFVFTEKCGFVTRFFHRRKMVLHYFLGPSTFQLKSHRLGKLEEPALICLSILFGFFLFQTAGGR